MIVTNWYIAIGVIVVVVVIRVVFLLLGTNTKKWRLSSLFKKRKEED